MTEFVFNGYALLSRAPGERWQCLFTWSRDQHLQEKIILNVHYCIEHRRKPDDPDAYTITSRLYGDKDEVIRALEELECQNNRGRPMKFSIIGRGEKGELLAWEWLSCDASEPRYTPRFTPICWDRSDRTQFKILYDVFQAIWRRIGDFDKAATIMFGLYEEHEQEAVREAVASCAAELVLGK